MDVTIVIKAIKYEIITEMKKRKKNILKEMNKVMNI